LLLVLLPEPLKRTVAQRIGLVIADEQRAGSGEGHCPAVGGFSTVGRLSNG